MNQRYIVIMAGGRGERFWPQSRLRRPKQLLPIVGDKPLLTQTVERVSGIVPLDNILVITNSKQRGAVLEVCPQLKPENVIGEPVGRDTAPAVGLATLLVQRMNPNATFAMLPADHYIVNMDAYSKELTAAFEAAEQHDALVTMGLHPTSPATGYGYIHRGGSAGHLNGSKVFKVAEFREKPDLETAQKYLDSGEYYWNGGMFIWRVEVVSRAFQENVPSLWKALQQISKGLEDGQSMESVLSDVYPNLEKISIDFALMEKAKNVLVVESSFDWDDVGEWTALERHYPADDKGNVTRGQSLLHGAKGNLVVSPQDRLTVIIGTDDLIVVETEDATLICPKSKSQEIKKAVREISKNPDWKHLV